jgi:capsular polysaccharide transport system permease protein
MADTTRRSWTGLRAIAALVLREMATTYGRSPGGYLWAILEPVVGVAVLTVVFSLAFRNPPIGANFALFYATGLLPIMIYTSLTTKMGMSIRFSRPLLAYPKVSFFDAIFSRLILNALTQVVVFIVVMSGLIWVFDLRVILDYGAIALSLAMIIALGGAIGTLNCFLMSRFPVWQQVWSILNRPMFIISGVFFLVDEVPEPYRSVLLINPVAHCLSLMRAGFYATYDAQLVSPTYVFLVAIVAMFFGVLLLYSFGRSLLETGA